MLKRLTFSIIGIIVLSLVPCLNASGFVIEMITQILILSLFAVSLNILIGYTGMVSFGHSAFYGVGAYTLGIILQKTSLSIVSATVAAFCFAGVASLVIGFFCTRLTAIYFAMLTLAFSQVVYAIITKLDWLTGGYQGLIGGIPKPKIDFALFTWDIGSTNGFYIFTVITVIISLLLINIVINSPFGCSLRAIKENDERTSYVGINVRLYQLMAFVISGSFAGLAGALMALYISGAYPNFVFWTTSAEPIFMILIGGASTFFGPVIGALVLFLLTSYLSAYTEFWGLVVGGILVLFTAIVRAGIVEMVSRSHRWQSLKKSFITIINRFYSFN